MPRRLTAAAMYAYVDQSLCAWNQQPLFKANLSRFEVIRRVKPMVPLSICCRVGYSRELRAGYVMGIAATAMLGQG